MSDEVIKGLFALGGAAIGVTGSFLVARFNKERRRLVVTISPQADLLGIGESVRSHVCVSYKGKTVSNLRAGEVAIQNTGNAAVKDIEMQLITAETSPIIEILLSSANFVHDKDFVQIEHAEERSVVRIKFLNRNDRLVVAYRSVGVDSPPQVVVRQENVVVITQKDLISWLPDIYAEVLYESLFKSMGVFGPLAAQFIRPVRLYLESKRPKK